MKIVYYGDEMPVKINKSIFLAGISLRPNQKGESWRKDALQILNDIGFDGTVFIPENRDGKFDEDHNYQETVEWEEKFLNCADIILFWVPRNIENELYGFTTNVEYGFHCNRGNVVLGFPEDADKTKYLKYYAEKYKVPVSNTLSETIQNALDLLEDGAERTDGERYIPYFIWKTESFQSWYKTLLSSDNKLESARLLYNFRPKYKQFIFLWVLQVNIYITTEDRYKSSEFVLSRTDISSVCMYHKNEIVLIKEFRSSVRNEEGFILELPSGSSNNNSTPQETASEEILEETGFYLEASRLEAVNSKQLAATLSSHHSTLFKVELTQEELEWFKSQKGIVHGNTHESEMTYIEVLSLDEIMKSDMIDWSNLGMILSVYNEH